MKNDNLYSGRPITKFIPYDVTNLIIFLKTILSFLHVRFDDWNLVVGEIWWIASYKLAVWVH